MSFLPLEITNEIIDVLAQDDLSFSSIKACALVCHEFHHLCRKHIFASIFLSPTHGRSPSPNTRSRTTKATTRMLQQLLDTSPEVAHHIRSLSFSIIPSDLRNSLLVETLKKITRLKSFSVWHFNIPRLQWNNNSLRPALLHLLHLPTLIHLKILVVENFLLSDLAPCINLEQLEIERLTVIDETSASNLPEKSIRIPNISTGIESTKAIMKMCTMRCADGKPFIDFSCIKNLTISMHTMDDVQATFNLLNRCNQLTSIVIDLQVGSHMAKLNLGGLFKMLYPSMQTLKHLHMKNNFYEHNERDDPLAGLSSELEKMKNENVIESIAIQVVVEVDSGWSRGAEWGRLDMLAQPGWPMLKRVSLEIIVWSCERAGDELECALRKLPQTHFPELSSSKSLSFEFSVQREQGL